MDDEGVYAEDPVTLECVNEAVFTLLLLGFAVGRSARSTLPSYNVFRGKLRSLGSLFTLTSVLFSAIYICLATYLSTRIDLDKTSVEIVGRLRSSYVVKYRDFKIDLAYILNISLVMSRVLRMSAVFLLIGLWGPCAYSAFNSGGQSLDIVRPGSSGIRTFIAKSMFNTSVVTFSKIYAILRAPALFYYYCQQGLFEEKTAIFLESFLLGGEVYLAVALLIVLRTKHSFLSEHKSLDSTNLLSVCLLFHGFLAYTVNTVSVPFETTDLHHQVLQSLSFGVKVVLDMLLISMFCPVRNQLFDNVSEKHERCFEVARISQLDSSGPMIQEIESVIDFGEQEEAR